MGTFSRSLLSVQEDPSLAIYRKLINNYGKPATKGSDKLTRSTSLLVKLISRRVKEKKDSNKTKRHRSSCFFQDVNHTNGGILLRPVPLPGPPQRSLRGQAGQWACMQGQQRRIWFCFSWAWPQKRVRWQFCSLLLWMQFRGKMPKCDVSLERERMSNEERNKRQKRKKTLWKTQLLLIWRTTFEPL